jgi:hypothetical protein
VTVNPFGSSTAAAPVWSANSFLKAGAGNEAIHLGATTTNFEQAPAANFSNSTSARMEQPSSLEAPAITAAVVAARPEGSLDWTDSDRENTSTHSSAADGGHALDQIFAGLTPNQSVLDLPLFFN